MADAILNDPTNLIIDMSRRVEQVVAAGGNAPAAYCALLAGWDAHKAPIDVSAYLASYLAAIASGDAAAVQAAKLELDAASNCSIGTYNVKVARSTLSAMREAYRPVGASNYKIVAKRWNEVARSLMEAAAVVPLDTPAEQLIDLGTGDAGAALRAWTDAAVRAAELDKLLPLLGSAAQLAGHPTTAAADASLEPTKADDWMLTLAVTPTDDADRRAVWAAWDDDAATHRCGRWGALVQAGVVLKARDLSDVVDYRRPKLLIHKAVRSGIGFRNVTVDPEKSGSPVAGAVVTSREAHDLKLALKTGTTVAGVRRDS